MSELISNENKLGTYIYELRATHKLSLRDAAQKIGISHSYLSTIEKGIDPRNNTPVKPTPEVLKFISDAYRCDYNTLMELAGYIKEPISDVELSIEEQQDVEVAIKKTFEMLEKQKSLMLSGEDLTKEDWNKVKDAVLLGLEFAKKSKKK